MKQQHLIAIADKLNNQRLLVTGGTGFFGKSLVDFLRNLTSQHQIQLHLTLISRSAMPQSTSPNEFLHIEHIPADVTNLKHINGQYDYIMHMATPASASLNIESPLLMLTTITDGMRETLDLAVRSKAKSYLFTSSGAAYGPQPSELTHIPETYAGAPSANNTASAYGEGKRYSELLGAIYSQIHGLNFKVARCFAFVGPHLSPTGTFAIGNFIADAIRNKAIEIKSDGSPYRSYLHSEDLCIWLLKIMLDGQNNRAYNVGSDKDLQLKELAFLTASTLNPSLEVKILGRPSGEPSARYVPSIERARSELGLDVWTSLEESIALTANHYRNQLV